MNSYQDITSLDWIHEMTDPSTESFLLEACWQHFVLGVVQGLTEFLPISSTAHLKIVPLILGWEDPGLSTTAVIQLGSIFAVLSYFQQDLLGVLKGIELAIRNGQWKEKEAQLGIAIFVGCAPILLSGMAIKLFWNNFESSFLRSVPSIALISICMALLLGLAERIGARTKSLEEITGKDGLIIGLAQALALMPGVSRSGITLTTSMLTGWNREDAARFSFLLGVPAISIVGLVELQSTFSNKINTDFLPLIVGIVSSAIVSWLAIDWLLKFLKSNNTYFFVFYRLFFGFGIIFWWLHII